MMSCPPSLCAVFFSTLLLTPMCSGIICYHCDSIALEECAMTLNDEVDTMPYVTCDSDISCSMSIVDSITYRGCSDDTPVIGAAYRKSCNTNLCNRGVYPPGRLKCQHCHGGNCVDSPSSAPRPCRFYNEIDQCYTEVINATQVYRGCVSGSNHTVGENVVLCDYNGCNGQSAATTLTCARCDSNDDLGCKMELFNANKPYCNITLYETCTVTSLLTQKATCYTYHRMDRVVRGCTEDMSPEIQQDSERVQLCDNDFCNRLCLNQSRCLTCDSVQNENCRSNTSDIALNYCGSAEVSSCYACEHKDWSQHRGCGRQPKISSEVLHCYECDTTEGCNRALFTRCYGCRSENNTSCATWQRPNSIYIEECQIPSAQCVIAVYQNGTTIRGCQREGFNCSGQDIDQCKSCVGSFCNKGDFPTQRLWCYQCAGGYDCGNITTDPMPCTWKLNEPLEAINACLEYYDIYTEMVTRGCRTDSKLYYECMLRNNGTGCRVCKTHGCNDTPGNDLSLNVMRSVNMV